MGWEYDKIHGKYESPHTRCMSYHQDKEKEIPYLDILWWHFSVPNLRENHWGSQRIKKPSTTQE